MASQPVLLPWLDGLDRETGGPSQSPTGFTDLRNIIWFPGAVRLRPGLGDPIATLSAPVVCAVSVFQAYGILCWVLYDPATREVTVVQTNLQGQSETAVGTWGTLSASASSPPRFTMAESFGILVFAHDEPNVVYRLDTYRFDPADTGNEWDGIEADLDGAGTAPVVFRGVVQHLGAIWGWGFGSASDPDRPEVLRRSSPDDPEVYVAEQYVQFGARLDPVIGACPVGGSLAVLKGSSWYRLDGNTAATFSPQLVDPVIGLVSPRALQNIGGTLYWWSPYGPRMTTGGTTTDISGVLDLTGPLPPDLPVEGPGAYAFSYYDPNSQKLGFAFPAPDNAQDSTLAFAVDLGGQGMRWALDVFGRAVLCSVLASTGEASFAIDPGTVDNVTVTGSAGGGTASATIGWDNVDCVGDELVEVWGSMNSGPWTLMTTVPVNTSTTPQTTVVMGGILTNGTLDVAIRMRRLGRYDPLYTDPDPSMWPPASQGSGTIVLIDTPAGLTASYTPSTGMLAASWTMGTTTADIEVRAEAFYVYFGVTYTGGASIGSATRILPPATLNLSGTTFGASGAISTPSNPWGLVGGFGDVLTLARSNGLLLRLSVRGRIGAVVGNWSSSVDVWIGAPNMPTLPTLVWSKASVALGTELTWDWTDSTDVSGASLVKTLGAVFTSADPPNGGSCPTYVDTFLTPPLSPTIAPSLLLDATGTGAGPVITPAPTCAVCQGIGQTVNARNAWIRQRLTIGGLIHWTGVVAIGVTLGPGPTTCGV